MRIGLVNDLPIAIAALRRALKARPRHEIAWVAQNGAEAVEHCLRDRPDLVLMDLVMPVMGGVEATRRIMAQSPCLIVVVTSSISSNVSKVFEAMGAGAVDAVDTPQALSGRLDIGPLVAKLDTMERLMQGSGSPENKPEPILPPGGRTTTPLVAIGASAGGPAALAAILRELPRDFPAALAIVQHVDERFAPPLVRWLNDQSQMPVTAAEEGETPQPGRVLLATLNHHLCFTDPRHVGYNREPDASFYRPSVDVFFESVVCHWKGKAAGVLLSGMGRDGARGLLHMREAGFHTIAQDEATSAVYGMPKAAAQLGAPVDILPLPQIASALGHWCQKACL